MKEIKLQNNTYLFVEIPKSAYNFSVYKYGITSQLRYFYDGYQCDTTIEKADWKIISTTKDITEEQVSEIVYEVITNETKVGIQCFENYDIEELYCLTAKESLQSLIQANGLDITKNYLILLKL